MSINNFNKSSAIYPRFGMKIDFRKISSDDFQTIIDGKFPVILTNVFEIDNEQFTESLINKIEDELVTYDVRNSDGEVESFECTLNDYLKSLSQHSASIHDESMYLMNEKILKKTSIVDQQLKLPGAFGIDYFQYFPSKIRPKSALIIGGVGARSFLHVDPYNWTGWNYLLEGRKLWTFLPPKRELYPLLNAYQKIPDAWDSLNLTCGYLSDLDLYHDITSPSMKFILGKLNKKKDFNDIEIDIFNKVWLESFIEYNHMTKGNVFKEHFEYIDLQRNLNVPVFSSSEAREISQSNSKLIDDGSFQIVQEEGELILIPPGYWHQVYHLQPSIAVASQYCNHVIKNKVFKNILSYCGCDEETIQSVLNHKALSPHEEVDIVLRTALSKRLGVDDCEPNAIG